jgi:plastocyanin
MPSPSRAIVAGAALLALVMGMGAQARGAGGATGRIVGTVTVTDALPPNPLADRAMPPPSIVRGDPEILNVVVSLKTAPRTASVAGSADLAQVEQEFVPGVLPIQAGTTVRFPNRDPLFHNVFSLSPLASFDLGQYPTGESRSVRFTRPGAVKVFCKIHSFMSAVVLVFDHPFFTVPARDGTFALKRVPPGRYRLVTWHERGRPLEQAVTVRAGADTRVAIVYPGPAIVGTQP